MAEPESVRADVPVPMRAPADCAACCADGVVYRVDEAGIVTVPPASAASLLAHRFTLLAAAASPDTASSEGDAADATPPSPKRRR